MGSEAAATAIAWIPTASPLPARVDSFMEWSGQGVDTSARRLAQSISELRNVSIFTILDIIYQIVTLIDAIRVSDNTRVYIKPVRTGDEESQIAMMLSAEPLRSDPRNHCVPVLDLFQDDEDPRISYMVMPLLRDMDKPSFEMIEEVLDFVDQILEVSAPRALSAFMRLRDHPGTCVHA